MPSRRWILPPLAAAVWCLANAGTAAAADARAESSEADLADLEERWPDLHEVVRHRLLELAGEEFGEPAARPDWQGLAAAWPALAESTREEMMRLASMEYSMPVGIFMLVLLFTAFFAMTRYNVPLPLAMALAACAFLALQAEHAQDILRHGFSEYADIVILFTAVAIPAHMIERSQGFRLAAAWLGYRFGRMRLSTPRLATPILVFVMLLATYVTAALMHNVTSILIMTPIIIRLCDSYRVPSRWLLCGALVASNLGGFSTRWGDTPNIIESATWQLTAVDFAREVLPANLLVLAVLSLAVAWLTNRTLAWQTTTAPSASQAAPGTLQIALGAGGWKQEQERLAVDRRLLAAGLATMTAFIVLHVVFDELKIQIGAATILTALALERRESRFETLKSLGYDVYLAFAAIFVLAGCVANSWIGFMLREQIVATEAQPWAIALTGYLGTTFTEAASWATAASSQIYALGESRGLVEATQHSAAWALGGGICAGSSSILTAASAGIILAEESGRFMNERHRVTFRKYLPFGLAFSLFMLVFYSVYFTVVRY
jgi:Na+/H+ antiporter NhaD/arsenite permease-like protein